MLHKFNLSDTGKTNLFVKMLEGVIGANRLEAYQSLKAFWKQYKKLDVETLNKRLIPVVLGSHGWNILVSELPALQELMPKHSVLLFFVAVRSPDIAHYMLVRELINKMEVEYSDSDDDDDGLINSLILHAPQNISYYTVELGIPLTKKKFTSVVLENFWEYDVSKPVIRDFVLQVVKYMSKSELIEICRRGRRYTQKEIAILRILITHPNATLEFLRNHIVNPYLERNKDFYLSDFKSLYQTLKLDLSVYIEADIFEGTNTEIINYILSLRRIPEEFLPYFKMALRLQDSTEIIIPEYNPVVPEFTVQELKYLINSLINTIHYIYEEEYDEEVRLVVDYIKVNLPTLFPVISTEEAEAIVDRMQR